MGRTSIMLKVISFFFGVTILAKWRFVGQEQCPSRNPFQRAIKFSSNTSGTHIKSGCVHPQHPGAVVVLVWRMACFKSVNWIRVFSDKFRHSGGTDSNMLTTLGSISSSRFQNCPQSRKNALWSFKDQIRSIQTWLAPVYWISFHGSKYPYVVGVEWRRWFPIRNQPYILWWHYLRAHIDLGLFALGSSNVHLFVCRMDTVHHQ